MKAFAAAQNLELLIPEGATGLTVTGTPGHSGFVLSNLFVGGESGWSGVFAANKAHPHVTLTFPRRVRADWIYIQVWWLNPTQAPTEFRLFGFDVAQQGISQVGRPIYSAVMHQDTDWVANEEMWIEIPPQAWAQSEAGYVQYLIDFPSSKGGLCVSIARLNFAQRIRASARTASC
jgi:hypothetical protein